MDAFARGDQDGSSSLHQRSLSLWMPRLASAEAQNQPHRDLSTARSRDLAMSSAYAANALRIHRDNVIGPRFTLALRPMYQLLGISREQSNEWSLLAEREWEAYASSPTFDCDAARSLTFPWLLHMLYYAFLTAGEGLAVIKWLSSGSYSTCLQVIEPERLSNPPDRMPSQFNIRNGVEFDKNGAPAWYYIRKVHPSDVVLPYNSPDAYKWLRVRRSTTWGRPIVLHMLDRTRAEMRRGISQFVSVLRHMKLLDEYDGAEVESAIMRTMVAAVIKTELPKEEVHAIMGARPTAAVAAQAGLTAHGRALDSQQYMAGIADFRKEQALTMSGARIAQLLPGETLELLQAKSDGLAFEAFQASLVRKLAAGLGTTAESLSRDFGQMSYASAMVSIGDIWRHFLVRREMVIRQCGLPYVMSWLEEAIDERRLPLPNGKFGTFEDLIPMRNAIFARSTFMSWGPPQVDPVKQREGQKKAIEIGLSTHQEEAYAEGLDWREMLDQIAIEREYKDTLGIPQLENLPPGQPQAMIDAAAAPDPPPAAAKKK